MDEWLPLAGVTMALLSLIGGLFAWLRRQIQMTILEQEHTTAWRTKVGIDIEHLKKRLDQHGEDLKGIAEKADIASWKIATEKDIERLNERLNELYDRAPAK